LIISLDPLSHKDKSMKKRKTWLSSFLKGTLHTSLPTGRQEVARHSQCKVLDRKIRKELLLELLETSSGWLLKANSDKVT